MNLKHIKKQIHKKRKIFKEALEFFVSKYFRQDHKLKTKHEPESSSLIRDQIRNEIFDCHKYG